MDIKKELGEKIKRLRKQNALTQEQLAEMIDISSRNLSNIEQGISFPKPETLEHILTSLNTTTQELFANEHIKTKEELVDQRQIFLFNDGSFHTVLKEGGTVYPLILK